VHPSSSFRSRRRRLGPLLVALVVLAGCAGSVASEEARTGETLGGATLAHYAATPATTTTTTPTTTTTSPDPDPEPVAVALPELPTPEPLPVDPYQHEPDDTAIGRIAVPRLGIDEPLHQGMSLTAINRGPSHWPGTAGPGQMGNMVIAGHRTTYSRPFYDLDRVRAGDEMIVTFKGDTHVYQAVRTEIVDDDAVWIADQTYEFTATTFACHPKGSARQRIVVFWQLVDDAGEPVPAAA
jgi:sortase A